jgi:CRP/FNR family cyclic AMP-dependent transcriptional regulator
MQSSLVDFVKQYPLRTYAKSEVILRVGDSPTMLFAIQRGFVKVISIDDGGNEQLLWIAGRLDAIPTELLFSLRTQVQCYYIALTDIAVYEVEKQAFLSFAKDNLSLMNEIAQTMSMHYDDLLYRLKAVEQTSASGKIVHTLHNLGMRFSSEDMVDLVKLGLDLTHQDISDMVGLTRETTSLELNKLRTQKAIWYDRKNFVLNMKKLEELIV